MLKRMAFLAAASLLAASAASAQDLDFSKIRCPVVLWETTVGRKLFKGQSDRQLLQRITFHFSLTRMDRDEVGGRGGHLLLVLDDQHQPSA